MRGVSYELAAGFPLLFDLALRLWRRGALGSYREFLLFKLRAISLTACAWDMTILKPYCMKKREREREQDVVRKKNLIVQETHKFITHIYVRLCVSLYNTALFKVKCWCHCLVPGSSWLPSSTWCTHAHHLSGSRGGSSWWFCCLKPCHSCNRRHKLISGRDAVIKLGVLLQIWCLI